MIDERVYTGVGYTFGGRVRAILSYEGISQRDFARRADINESQLSKLLNGKRKPLFHEVVSIVNTLGIPYELLVGKSPLFDRMLYTLEQVSSESIW